MELTKAQLKAYQTTDRSVAIIASAGSGKTRVLTEHYRHLVAELDIPVYRILAFTFTDKAASEMRHRILKQKIIQPFEENLAQIGTLHAFFAKLLRQYGPRLGLDPSFEILAGPQAEVETEMALKAFFKTKLADNNSALSGGIDQFGYAKLFDLFLKLKSQPEFFFNSPSSNNPLASVIELVQEFFTEFQQQKIAQARLHFDDLEYLGLRLLDDENILNSLRKKYQHILIDEFQDTNPVQGQLIEKLYDPDQNHLFIVGDPKQSIYRFRRADPAIMTKMVEKIKDQEGETIYLNDTFRMTDAITQTVNHIFSHLFAESGSYQKVVSQRDPATNPGQTHLIFAPKEKLAIDKLRTIEAQWIAQKIHQLDLNPDQLSQTALLFRSKTAIPIYQKQLLKAGIDCTIAQSSVLLEQEEVKGLMHLLNYLADDESKITLAGILGSIYFDFSENFQAQFLKAKQIDLTLPVDFDLFTSETDKQEIKRLQNLLNEWQKLKNYTPFAKLLGPILNSLCQTHSLTAQQKLNCETFINLIAQIETQKPGDKDYLKQCLDQMLTSSKPLETIVINPKSSGVVLMTMHASKGLEFERVFLPQLYAVERNSLPDIIYDSAYGFAAKRTHSADTVGGLKIQLEESPEYARLKKLEEADQKQELKRLLYVAMTRAKDDLFLFLKEPSNKRLKLSEAKNFNEWLWLLTYGQHQSATQLSTQAPKSVSFNNLAHKIETALEVEEKQEPLLSEENLKAYEMVSHQSIKPIYTVSTIETYLRCEKEYQLKYQWGLNPTASKQSGPSQKSTAGLSATAWGNLVHEVLQFLDMKSLSNEKTVVEQALLNQQLSDKNGKIFKALRQLIVKLMDDPEVNDILYGADKSMVETPFILDRDRYFIKGTIDRLVYKKDCWWIVDYKTDFIEDHHDLKKREAAYFGQIASYALAASEILGVKHIKTALIFTDGPFVRVQDWDAFALEKTKGLLDELHQKLAPATLSPDKTRFEFPDQTHHCSHCPYFEKNWCGIKDQIQ